MSCCLLALRLRHKHSHHCLVHIHSSHIDLHHCTTLHTPKTLPAIARLLSYRLLAARTSLPAPPTSHPSLHPQKTILSPFHASANSPHSHLECRPLLTPSRQDGLHRQPASLQRGRATAERRYEPRKVLEEMGSLYCRAAVGYGARGLFVRRASGGSRFLLR